MSAKGFLSSLGGGDARTDSGWITSATIAQAAAIAVTAMQVNAAKEIADKQIALAEKYYDMAKKLQDYWFTVFKPCEEKTVAESCGEPIYEPEYEEQAARYVASARLQFSRARESLSRCVSRFCTGARDSFARDLAIAEAKATTDAMNYAARYAEHRAQALNDIRWNKRTQMLNLGRGLFAPQLSYAQAAGQAYSSLGQQANQAVGNSLYAMNYLANRNQQPVTPYQSFNQQMLPNNLVQSSPSALLGSFQQPTQMPQQQSWFSQPYQQPTNYEFNASSVTSRGGMFDSFGGTYTLPADGGFFTTNNPGTGG